MKFVSISLKNFKSYGDTEQTVDLDHVGIKLVSGKNMIGKTTIFEAILWCLYGRSLQESADDVINWITKKNCKVSVALEIKGIQYTIYRYRAHETHGNALYIFQDDKNLSLKNIADTQELILDIIQQPFTALTNSVLFSSELYSSFLRSSRADRLKVLESVLSLKEITAYYDIVKEVLSKYDEEISIHKEKTGKASVGIETIKQTIEQYKEKAKLTLMSLKKERVDIAGAIETLNNDLKEINKIDVSNELSNVDKIEKNNIILEKINVEKNKLIDIASFEVKTMNLLDEIERLKTINVEEEIVLINEYEKAIKEIQILDNEIDIKKSSLVSEEEINYLNQQYAQYLVETSMAENDLKKINEEKKCPVCHKPLDNEEIKQDFIDKKERYSKACIDLQTKILFSKEKNTLLIAQINALNTEASIIDVVKSNYTREQLSGISGELNKLNIELSILQTKIKENEKSNTNVLQSIAVLKKDLFDVDTPKYNKEFLTNLSIRKDSINKLIQEHINRINVIDETAKTVYDKSFVEQHEDRIKSIQAILLQEEKEINNINEEKKYYDILLTLFSNKEAGFKKYFIGKMIGFFNESINFYLPFFFNKGINVQFDKDLNEIITYDGKEVSFKSFSAGGKTRIEIATAFALFQLSKTFFSSDTNLLVFDEILDQNLDVDGFEAVIEVIKGMAENSIFIISHQDAIKDSFDDIINIENENGFSKIVI